MADIATWAFDVLGIDENASVAQVGESAEKLSRRDATSAYHASQIANAVVHFRMGEYAPTGATHEGRGVWAKGDTSFLYFSKGAWRVGAEVGSDSCVLKASSKVRLPTKSNAVWYERKASGAMQGHPGVRVAKTPEKAPNKGVAASPQGRTAARRLYD